MERKFESINLHSKDLNDACGGWDTVRLYNKWRGKGRRDGLDSNVATAAELASVDGLFFDNELSSNGLAKKSRARSMKALHHKKMYAPVTRMTADEYNQLK
jgi:hypothetical protein